jgi:hypothetical protein
MVSACRLPHIKNNDIAFNRVYSISLLPNIKLLDGYLMI